MPSSNDSQLGLYVEEAEFIQQVIYYCDSRLRVALGALDNLDQYPDAQQIMQARIEQELVSRCGTHCVQFT